MRSLLSILPIGIIIIPNVAAEFVFTADTGAFWRVLLAAVTVTGGLATLTYISVRWPKSDADASMRDRLLSMPLVGRMLQAVIVRWDRIEMFLIASFAFALGLGLSLLPLFFRGTDMAGPMTIFIPFGMLIMMLGTGLLISAFGEELGR